MKIARKAAAVVVALALSATAGSAELMTLVDSNGVVVGPVATIDDGGDELRVAFRVGKRTLLVQFLPSAVDSLGGIYFLTDDCSGAPFMKIPADSSPQFSESYAIGGPGRTLYVRDYSRAVQTRTALSAGGPGSCVTTNLTGKFGLATAVFDFSVYTPPFRIRANASAPLYPAP